MSQSLAVGGDGGASRAWACPLFVLLLAVWHSLGSLASEWEWCYEWVSVCHELSRAGRGLVSFAPRSFKNETFSY